MGALIVLNGLNHCNSGQRLVAIDFKPSTLQALQIQSALVAFLTPVENICNMFYSKGGVFLLSSTSLMNDIPLK